MIVYVLIKTEHVDYVGSFDTVCGVTISLETAQKWADVEFRTMKISHSYEQFELEE